MSEKRSAEAAAISAILDRLGWIENRITRIEDELGLTWQDSVKIRKREPPLTPGIVREIRARQGRPGDIAGELNVTVRAVRNVLAGKTWKNVS